MHNDTKHDSSICHIALEARFRSPPKSYSIYYDINKAFRDFD